MFKKLLSLTVILCFFLTSLGPLPQAHADSILNLPAPGTMINLSPAYQPVMIKGLTVHKDNPFLFDFIVDIGQDKMSGEPLKKEGEKLIKYFLASLAIPDRDMWVNLSPYEKTRMIPEALGQTDMGKDLLEQDYILKQITASLIYPEKNLGKRFWDRVYAKAQEMYGTTQIPVNTFNKVWIKADRAEVYEHNQTVFVVASHLKVMLEEDYLALQKHATILPSGNTHTLSSQIIREIVLPELEKEVNTGKNFANLRQMFHSIILASWYKKNLKEALLNQVYANKSKIKGINLNDPTVKEAIYQQYIKAYKKGVFNYIKEDINTVNGQAEPRKYFSGGVLAIATDVKSDGEGEAYPLLKGETQDSNFETLTTGFVFNKPASGDFEMQAKAPPPTAIGMAQKMLENALLRYQSAEKSPRLNIKVWDGMSELDLRSVIQAKADLRSAKDALIRRARVLTALGQPVSDEIRGIIGEETKGLSPVKQVEFTRDGNKIVSITVTTADGKKRAVQPIESLNRLGRALLGDELFYGEYQRSSPLERVLLSVATDYGWSVSKENISDRTPGVEMKVQVPTTRRINGTAPYTERLVAADGSTVVMTLTSKQLSLNGSLNFARPLGQDDIFGVVGPFVYLLSKVAGKDEQYTLNVYYLRDGKAGGVVEASHEDLYRAFPKGEFDENNLVRAPQPYVMHNADDTNPSLKLDDNLILQFEILLGIMRDKALVAGPVVVPYTTTQLAQLMDHLGKQFSYWAAQEPASRQHMLPTLLTGSTGSEEGISIGIDFSGTNLHLRLIRVKNGKIEILAQEDLNWEKEVPNLDKSNVNAVFDAVAEKMDNLLVKARQNGIDLPSKIKTGFSFAFPIKQNGLAVGHLLRPSKGWFGNLIEGNVTDVLQKAVERRAKALNSQDLLAVHVNSLLNDTTAALLSVIGARLGVIIGTGFNLCIVMPNGEILNGEGGGIDIPEELKFQTDLDFWNLLTGPDQTNPSEKMITGEGLGELIRLQLLHLSQNHEMLAKLNERWIFDSKFITAVLSTKDPVQGVKLITDKLGITEITNPTEAQQIYDVFDNTMARAAQYAAAEIGAGLKQSDPDGSVLKEIGRYIFVVDGSTYWLSPEYKERVTQHLIELGIVQRADQLEIHQVDSPTAVGAGVAGLIADQSMTVEGGSLDPETLARLEAKGLNYGQLFHDYATGSYEGINFRKYVEIIIAQTPLAAMRLFGTKYTGKLRNKIGGPGDAEILESYNLTNDSGRSNLVLYINWERNGQSKIFLYDNRNLSYRRLYEAKWDGDHLPTLEEAIARMQEVHGRDIAMTGAVAGFEEVNAQNVQAVMSQVAALGAQGKRVVVIANTAAHNGQSGFEVSNGVIINALNSGLENIAAMKGPNVVKPEFLFDGHPKAVGFPRSYFKEAGIHVPEDGILDPNELDKAGEIGWADGKVKIDELSTLGLSAPTIDIFTDAETGILTRSGDYIYFRRGQTPVRPPAVKGKKFDTVWGELEKISKRAYLKEVILSLRNKPELGLPVAAIKRLEEKKFATLKPKGKHRITVDVGPWGEDAIYANAHILDLVVLDKHGNERVIQTYKNSPIITDEVTILRVGPETEKVWGAFLKGADAIILLGDAEGITGALKDLPEGQIRLQIAGSDTETMKEMEKPSIWHPPASVPALNVQLPFVAANKFHSVTVTAADGKEGVLASAVYRPEVEQHITKYELTFNGTRIEGLLVTSLEDVGVIGPFVFVLNRSGSFKQHVGIYLLRDQGRVEEVNWGREDILNGTGWADSDSYFPFTVKAQFNEDTQRLQLTGKNTFKANPPEVNLGEIQLSPIAKRLDLAMNSKIAVTVAALLIAAHSAISSPVAAAVHAAKLAYYGGIDLNTANGMQWKVSKDGKGVEMNINPAMLERIRREGLDNLSPVIFKMTPVTSIWPLVGLPAPVH